MQGFIEVTVKNRKQIIAVSEIVSVAETKKGTAIIFLKGVSISLFGLDDYICCNEKYEEICAKIKES